jgi:hypothetical protein
MTARISKGNDQACTFIDVSRPVVRDDHNDSDDY